MTLHDTSSSALTRRGFLVTALSAGGALVIGVGRVSPAAAAGPFAPNAFIRIPAEGKVALAMPSVEMGQGIYTAMAMLIAEELEVPLDQVELEHAPADGSRYANPFIGEQITGGSLSIRALWEPLRKAGAAARLMLVNAAAREWGVEPAACRAEAGTVVHEASGRSAPYGTLVEKAAAEAVPQDVPLKPASEFKLIGRAVRRLDSPGKVDGSARFGIDARPEAVSYAALSICPVFGGKLGKVDETEAMKVKGVRQVVRTEDAVAVVADNTGAARKGLAALAIEWVPGANGTLRTADLERKIDEAMEGAGLTHVTVGDVAKAEAENRPPIEMVYRLPILAHTAMEPMNCTLHVREDGCDVWVGTQVMERARHAVAEVTGLPVDEVVVHNHLLGGGFGRRLDVDGVIVAARIAKEVEGPVKVTWSREEDVRHDSYRYLNSSKLTVAVGRDGMPLSWRHRVVGPAVMARWLPGFTKDGIDLDIMDGAEGPYAIPNKHTDFVRHEAPEGMLTGNWRGVGPTRNAPGIEGAIDELAHHVGQDPVAYRRRLLADKPRLVKVLDVAAEKAGWATPLPPGKGRGVAVLEGFGSFAATVAELTVEADGSLRLDRVTCAVDCGLAVNPNTVEAQIQSGVVYGLSAVLYGRITVEAGAVVEGNFDDSPVLRIDETPPIDVHIVPSTEAPGGIGELGTPGIAPAVLNAIFAATGKRLRTLPVDASQLRRA